MTGGGYVTHLNETLATWTDVNKLNYCGMLTKFSDKELQIPSDSPFWQYQDDWADLLGRATLLQVANRVERSLWFIIGWPGRTMLMGHPNVATADSVMREFLTERDLFHEKCCVRNSRKAKVMQARSPFYNMANVQTYKIVESRHYQIDDPDVHAHFNSLGHQLASSILVEELFRAQRAEEGLGSCRNCKEERTWEGLVNRRVPSTRHQYDELPLSYNAPRNIRITKEMFYPSVGRNAKPARLTEVCGFNQTPRFPSPNAHSICNETTDTVIQAYCEKYTQWDILDDGWLAGVIRGTWLVMRRVDSQEWFFTIKEMGGQIVYGWPATVVNDINDANEAETYFLPAMTSGLDAFRKSWIVILDLDDWYAMPISFVSPGRLEKNKYDRIGHRRGLHIAGRICMLAMATGPEAPAIAVCADNCFGKCTKTFLQRLKKHLGAPGPDDNLYAVLYWILKDVFPDKTENDIVQLMSKRMDMLVPNFEELIAMDTAMDILLPDDRQKMEEEKKETGGGSKGHG